MAAALENLYKLSPPADVAEEKKVEIDVVRNRKRRQKRLGLEKRVEAMRKKSREGEIGGGSSKKEEEIERLVREYSVSTDLGRLDWRRVKIPPVLGSAEQTRLFKLMQPMKVR